jgi:hypothetical protein
MGARLQYAKVVDKEAFLADGGRVHPGLENLVILKDAPGPALAFLVLRGWGEDHGTFTEQWRIVGTGGGLVHESLPREIHLATKEHVERLEDELVDLEFEYAADDYNVVFFIDDREVARVTFPVVLPD